MRNLPLAWTKVGVPGKLASTEPLLRMLSTKAWAWLGKKRRPGLRRRRIFEPRSSSSSRRKLWRERSSKSWGSKGRSKKFITKSSQANLRWSRTLRVWKNGTRRLKVNLSNCQQKSSKILSENDYCLLHDLFFLYILSKKNTIQTYFCEYYWS